MLGGTSPANAAAALASRLSLVITLTVTLLQMRCGRRMAAEHGRTSVVHRHVLRIHHLGSWADDLGQPCRVHIIDIQQGTDNPKVQALAAKGVGWWASNYLTL